MFYAHSNLPKRLWAELVNTAAYIINRTGVSAVEGRSTFELWFGKKPSIKHLKVIGTTCYAHIPEQKRKKLDKKALKCVLIGYNGDDSYRLWHQESGDIKISRDVRIDKDVVLKSTVSTSIAIGRVLYILFFATNNTYIMQVNIIFILLQSEIIR